jgi:hypothetical protein
MANSRKPGSLSPSEGEVSVPARTPGTLGVNDQGDPNVTALLGDTPGPLGVRDQADPTLPSPALASAAPKTVDNATSITKACKALWKDNQNDCHEFVIAVASQFKITLTGTADDIMKQIKGPGWTSLGYDGIAASNAAKAGKLVIAGMTSEDLDDDNGHVVVVVAPTGALGHKKYPYAYWGSLNPGIRPNGGAGTTINFSFDLKHRDKVFYASTDIH